MGRVDILVNNAGTTKFVDHNNLDGLDAEDFQRIYGVNVIGCYQMTRAARAAMEANDEGGAVVNIGVYGSCDRDRQAALLTRRQRERW